MTICVRMVELTMPPIMKSNRQANGAQKDQEISGMGELYSLAPREHDQNDPFLRLDIPLDSHFNIHYLVVKTTPARPPQIESDSVCPHLGAPAWPSRQNSCLRKCPRRAQTRAGFHSGAEFQTRDC